MGNVTNELSKNSKYPFSSFHDGGGGGGGNSQFFLQIVYKGRGRVGTWDDDD